MEKGILRVEVKNFKIIVRHDQLSSYSSVKYICHNYTANRPEFGLGSSVSFACPQVLPPSDDSDIHTLSMPVKDRSKTRNFPSAV